MSNINSNESCKGEKTQSFINSLTQQTYYSNLELYNRVKHDRNHRESAQSKDLSETEQSHDHEQYHALSGGARRPELLAHDSMNPSASVSHSTAVASAATVYPRVISQQTRATPQSHFDAYGLSSHISSTSSPTGRHHSAPVHSSAHRHLVPHPNLMPTQFNNSSGPPHMGIDVMWQQKLNTNPWVLAHYEEMRERTLSQERERDHERTERQKEENRDKERQRDWEQERIEREERERVQREAVKQHFEESLRLIQKKNMGWNPTSSAKHPLKTPENSSSMALSMTQPPRLSDNERLKEQEKERSPYVDSNQARREHERWLAILQQQRNEQSMSAAHHQNFLAEGRSTRIQIKSETQQIQQGQRLPGKQNSPTSPVNSNSSQMKNEVNFSLYGYQPVRQTYITQAQLKAREEKERSMQANRVSSGQHKINLPLKNDKEDLDRSLSPNSSHSSSSKHQSKVVLSGHERNNMIYQPLIVTGGAFKPYEYSSNSNSPAPPAHQNTSPAVSGRIGTSHYPQLQDQPQNLVKSDGKSIQEIVQSHKYESKDSKLVPSTSTGGNLPEAFPSSYATSKSSSPAASATYSYSLIQQGLVPNPMYIASTHSGSNNSASTSSVSFSYSQVSKSALHPGSPPISQQYARASPNSGISCSSPICRPSSAPYSMPTARISRSYSPVGLSSAPGSGSSSKGHNNQDTLISNRAHISVQGSSHRSLSPAHSFGQQSNPSTPNSPQQSSTGVTNLPSQTPVHLSSVNAIPSSPFHSNSKQKTSESLGVPLVKRKLLNDVLSRKRPKPCDDSLLPPQLQPQIQTLCRDTSESRIITPPDLVSSAPILGEHGADSYSKSSPSSPLTSSNLAFKTESVANLTLMPDLSSSPVIHIEHSDIENSLNAQSFYNTNNKFKIPSKDSNINSSEEKDGSNNSVLSSNVPLAGGSEHCEEKVANLNNSNVTSSNNSNSSSSFHPKLKKAWLQRHSENEDRKGPSENSFQTIKSEDLFKIKSETKLKETDDCKSETCKISENSLELIKEETIGPCEEDSLDNTLSHSYDLAANEDISSSDSDVECEIKTGKKKAKTNQKYFSVSFGPNGSSKQVKSENTSDSAIDDQTSPKKEKEKKRSGLEKESSINSRKRGRKSKVRKSISKNTSATAMNPPEKPSLAQLKKTGESFLQDGSCCEVAPRLPKCRECRLTPHQRSKKMPNIFCRFYAYRKLRYGKNGTILSAGFSEPSDALDEDLKLWMPPFDSPPVEIEVETSKFLLTYLGDQFCDLVEMEREAKKLHSSSDDTITWKRVVQGVREMCDVCETTLFNIHWVCHKCGFVVCIDCYKLRKTGISKEESTVKDRDDYQWLLCSNKQPHEQEKLMLTQIIAGTALWDVGKSLHDIRRKWNIPTYCSCGMNSSDLDGKSSSNGINKLMCAVTKCFSSDKDSSWDSMGSTESQRSSKRTNKISINGTVKQEDGVGGYSSESGGSPLSWLADVALNSSTKNSDDQKDDDEEKSSEGQDSNADASVESDDDKNENFSTLRELLIRPTAKMGGKSSGSSSSSQKTLTSTLDEVISCVIEQKVRKSDKKCKEKQLLHFTRRVHMSKSGRELPPVRTCILAESSLLYPEIPHLWLGNGKILLLKDPYHTGNMQMFQEQWKRGQPVIIADIGTRLDSNLWTPESFSKDFGENKTDFFNCLCGTLVPHQQLKRFWEGFENVNKRMKDEDGESMVLKLIEWPPSEEFCDTLPTRYDDLMKVLPLPQYTHRDGVLNMASRLPECFVQPDLGPRMYNAYGISSSLGKGSTNLHLDVSDAINILAYVSSSEKEDLSPEILKGLEDSGCDSLMKKRAKERGSKPGALWHVYNARDADKIRDFLNKVSEEQGVKLNPHHDPIHNQEWYLDDKLRNRLFKEYGVEPYSIAQCLGDAIFIPAGSPHQVLNLQSCIKIAEDFVSPESVGHSFFLTQEIRNLSDNLVNSDDRLQIKNIIYHAVKDALALLQSHDPDDSKT